MTKVNEFGLVRFREFGSDYNNDRNELLQQACLLRSMKGCSAPQM